MLRGNGMIDLSPKNLLAIESRDLSGVSAELAKRLEAKIAQFAAPRDRLLAFEFIGKLGPLGSVLVYGAGAHSAELAPLLEDSPGTTVVGFIDRRWEAIGEFLGYEVIAPNQVPTRIFDHVLVANEVSEIEMAKLLLDLGVQPEKIVRVYTNPGYVRLALDTWNRTLAARMPERAKFVILQGAGGGLFYGSGLVDHLPPAETVVISYPCSYARTLFYREFETNHSLGLVIDLLRRMQPSVIYVRTQFTTHFLAHLARVTVPGAKIIHEFHDIALVHPCDCLVDQVCGSEQELETLRLAELDSLVNSDAVLSKYGGPEIEHLIDVTGANHALVYPYMLPILQKPKTAASASDRIRVVYAGQLYPPGQPRLLKTEWNYLPLFIHLVRTGRFTVDAFNSVHTLTLDNEKYGVYLETAREEPAFTYHRALGYRRAVERMSEFDWGFLYNDAPRVDNLSRGVAIAARLTGYLNAGLPVVIDDGHPLMAGLLREFSAGIVHPRYDIDGLVPALLAAHERVDEFREGARRLHAYMIESNARALEKIWASVEAK